MAITVVYRFPQDREALHSDPSPSPLLPALLDRSDHPVYHLPVVFFYSAADADADADLEILKSSLSTALASFYPLAGRLSGNSIVDCGDQGVEFFEARAPGADLSEILSSDEPDLDEPPYSDAAALPSASASRTRSPTADLYFRFCKRGPRRPEVPPRPRIPRRSTALLVFPPNANAVPYEGAKPPENKPPQVRKRFVLDGPRIAALREKTASSATTRFQAVAGLVWRSALRARPRARAAVATLVLDSRSRTEPPTPIGSFGNRCIAILVGIPRDVVENVASDVTNESANSVLEAEMGAAVKGVDAEYVRRLQGEDGWLRASELTWEEVQKCGGLAEAGFDMNIFSSWLRLPVYEVDFGWGPAAWACTTLLGPSAMVALPRPPSAGDPQGMELWASLEEDEMAELQRELDKLVRLNPVHHVGQP
uniref:Uncharacterized protein n=1 Tax=Ananas comosus var. bracteatus TaxID=296719 RepID=A0A6V7Q2H8_ANACO|nr:unnamed protein product [Ananas comosus var. bracteatus]